LLVRELPDGDQEERAPLFLPESRQRLTQERGQTSGIQRLDLDRIVPFALPREAREQVVLAAFGTQMMPRHVVRDAEEPRPRGGVPDVVVDPPLERDQ